MMHLFNQRFLRFYVLLFSLVLITSCHDNDPPRAKFDLTDRTVSGVRMMKPEVLSDVLKNSFGQRWDYYHLDNNTGAMVRNTYLSPIREANARVYMGGVDYETVVERPEQIVGTAPLVMRQLAKEYCFDLFQNPEFITTYLNDDPIVSFDFAADGHALDVVTQNALFEDYMDRLHRLIRSKPIDDDTLYHGVHLYLNLLNRRQSSGVYIFQDNFGSATTMDDFRWSPWIGVCNYMFLIDGGFSVY